MDVLESYERQRKQWKSLSSEREVRYEKMFSQGNVPD